MSGILEPDNVESHGDSFYLSVMDPTSDTIAVWLVRLVLFGGLFLTAGFFITFGAQQGSEPVYGAVGLGAALGYALCIGLCMFESYVLVPYWHRREIGKPMVHWLSWSVILDIIFHMVHPLNKRDWRQDLVPEQVPVLVEDGQDDKKKPFWLDFTADVGDGFNPTYAVFSQMAQAMLHVAPDCEPLPRANAVIVGGDVCYPWPRYADLLARFLRPVSWAFPSDQKPATTAAPSMYVMPGNHEWADGLRNFRRLVLDRTHIGAWQARNTTPYFSVQLPHGWWLFCVDPGNEAAQDLDDKQIEYFTQVVRDKTTPNDRFILCVHEPDWIKNSVHGFSLFGNLAKFRADVLGSRLRLTLAGDLHYYRRMEELNGPGVTTSTTASASPSSFPSYHSSKRQLVVAGNGGAFGHPTYVPQDGATTPVRLGWPHIPQGPEYVTVCNHPTPEASRATYDRLWLTGFSFGKNHAFGSILGLAYLGCCAAVSPMDYLEQGDRRGFPSASLDVLPNTQYMLRMVSSFWFYPAVVFMSAVLFVIGTTSHAMHTWRWVAVNYALILAHIGAHVLSLLAWRKLIDAFLAGAIFSGSELTFDNVVAFTWASNTLMYAAGFFYGPLVTALHLKISQDYIGASYNEGMSTIEYQDDKGFVRMRLGEDGAVDLYSIGIRKVPQKWRQRTDEERTSDSPGFFASADMDAIETFVVEHVRIARGEDD